MLQGKKILLGVTGSIAAYKAAILVRELIKQGAEVKVVMTASASEFITPLTLSTLSKNPVHSDFIKNESGEWNNHVELGLWADLMVIAPASANTIAKMAHGLCDNLLLAVYLSARCPVMFAPAMDFDMFLHPATCENIYKLKSFGNILIDAEHGELASGLVGKGRMAEPEMIVNQVQSYFLRSNQLLNKRILITAGPTCEAIDPVRYISNHSTGKMGYAIAEKAAEMGGDVTLVSGPVKINAQHKNIKVVSVQSASEMYAEADKYFDTSDIAILAAAVADYTPKVKAEQKIKKKEDEFQLEMTRTVDIAKELGKKKKAGQLLVGFALETENERENAKGKMLSKNFDLIILNSLNDKGAGFGHDTNKITILSKDNKTSEFELKTKKEVAQDIMEIISSHITHA